VLWRGDVGKSGGTVTLTHENGGALEQRRWHATLDHDGDAVLGHGGCRAGMGGEAMVGGGQAPSASDTERRPVGALWHGRGTWHARWRHRADERAWCGKREADRWDPAADFILN
jgi:hypothetical protein